MENTIETNVTYMKEEDIRKAYDANNLDVINGVLAGTIKTEKNQQVEIPVQNTTVQNTDTIINDVEKKEENELEKINKQHEEEKQRLRSFIEEEEKKYKESEQLNDSKISAILKQYEEEKTKREELEKKINEIKEHQKSVQPSLYTNDEDEDLVSTYAKNTRKMIEDLKIQLKDVSENNPEYIKLKERIQKFEEAEAERIRQEEQNKAERKAKEAQERILNDIRSFQTKYPEMQTTKDYAALNDEFVKFKEELSRFAKVTEPKDVDRILMTYFDEERGQKLRENAASVGIQPPEEIDKFVAIAELIDMTRGVEYDPVLERFVNIKNQFGEPVRYRSIEESYKVKHYYDEINKAKKTVANQISNKLTSIKQSPVTIPNNETSQIEDGLTRDQISQVIRNAELYVHDRSRYALLQRAYAAIGQDPPAYRGK